MKENLVETLKNRLHNGAVHFTFTKASGETRKAYGTLSESVKSGLFDGLSGKTTPNNPDVTRYYDLDKDQWRSFINANVISIDD